MCIRDSRKAVNNGEIAYNDIHLSQMAQEVRYGFMGKVNVAIIEACELTPDGKIYLTAAGGISPTICRLADQIIVELNSAHSKSCMGLHDVYEPLDPPYRREIPIYKPSDRIGLPYIQVDPKKIVEMCIRDRGGNQWNELRRGRTGLAVSYQVKGIPHYVLIAPSGKIQDMWSGYGSGSLLETVKKNLK